MITVDEICEAAAKDLKSMGCENYVLAVKCPDSNELFMIHNGNKIFNIGACELAGEMIKDEIKGIR